MPGVFSIVLSLFLSSTQDFQKFTQPPGPESTEVAALIDKAITRMNENHELSLVLCDPKFMHLHPFPRFREAAKELAPVGKLTYAAPPEPGDPLDLTIRVLQRDGQPAAGLLVYLYQTSAKGLYAQDAAHFQAQSGDFRHARLFGYVYTDLSGSIQVQTIRPAGYPDSDLPAHIHVDLYKEGRMVSAIELLFDDDPRLSEDMRRRSRPESSAIVAPRRKGSNWVAVGTIRLTR